MTNTHEQACRNAENLVNNGKYVSLGSWGGYMVVKFNHSVWNKENDEYDFAVLGNSFYGSSEPGIVWMRTEMACLMICSMNCGEVKWANQELSRIILLRIIVLQQLKCLLCGWISIIIRER